jgi:hypothetical protein
MRKVYSKEIGNGRLEKKSKSQGTVLRNLKNERKRKAAGINGRGMERPLVYSQKMTYFMD